MLQFNSKRSLDENVGLLIAVSDAMFCEKNPIKILWLLVANYLSQLGQSLFKFSSELFHPFKFHDIIINVYQFHHIYMKIQKIKPWSQKTKVDTFECDCRKILNLLCRISKMLWRMQNIGKNCKLCPLLSGRQGIRFSIVIKKGKHF